MTPLAFDTETALIRPALLAPPMVCATWATQGNAPGIEHWSKAEGMIGSWLRDASLVMTGHFMAFDMAVTCSQFPRLIRLVFDAYRANRITCTKKRAQLLDIAGGVYRGRFGEKGKWIVHNYDLESLSRRYLGYPMQKDGWRLSYAKFRDYPLERWPARAVEVQAEARARRAEIDGIFAAAFAQLAKVSATARKEITKPYEDEIKNLDAIIADVPEGVIRYPLDDARTTLDVFKAQEKHAEYLKDQYRQAYADFVLYLSTAWGLRTWGPGVEALRAELEEAYRELEGDMRAAGFVRTAKGKHDGTRDMKLIKRAMIDACREYSLPVRFTDAHFKKNDPCTLGDACEEHISLDADAFEAVVDAAGAAADGVFFEYAEFAALKKMLSNDVKLLESGIEYPIHPRYDLAETGRTTCSPNIQNMNTGKAKKGQEHRTSMRMRPSIRQAFHPRPGQVFMQCDYPQLELYTLAQWCFERFGFSKLGDALNAGLDPHLAFAAKMLKISYDEAERNKKSKDVDTGRRIAKAFNFGKPGGMGDPKFIASARKMYGVEIDPVDCKRYTAQWYETFPEMELHFAWARQIFGWDVKCASVESVYTQRHRGGTRYCAACNNGFQGLGIDCAKAALCLIGEAEYAIPTSPLFGSRTGGFVHDEVIGETADTPAAHDAAFELARLMCVGANQYLPNVPIKIEKMAPALMRVWSKSAGQVCSCGWVENQKDPPPHKFGGEHRLVPWEMAA